MESETESFLGCRHLHSDSKLAAHLSGGAASVRHWTACQQIRSSR